MSLVEDDHAVSAQLWVLQDVAAQVETESKL